MIAIPVVTMVSQATRAFRILADDRIQNGIGDLIGHLVRMSLRHRFRGE